MELLKIYPQGEGLITYYLLESLYNDLKLKKYPLATDRPLPLKNETLIAVVEKAQEVLTVLGNIKVFSKDCKGLSNCSEFKTDLWLKALKEILKMLGENNIFTAIEKWEQEVKKGLGLENGETLKELINFYIPVLVGKRKSYLFAWKYNLTRRGTPSLTFKYPQEGEGFFNFLSNPVFSDKLVPLFLGFLEKELTQKVKNLGFVPYTVMGKGRTPLETELNLIELSFKV